MKKNVAVVGAHVAVLGAISLLSGCFTPSPGNEMIPTAARGVKGPIRHVHPGKDLVISPIIPIYNEGDLDPFNENETVSESGFNIREIDIEYNNTSEGIPTPPPPAKYETYIVQPGDILSRLAVRFDTRTATLVDLNNLSSPDVIYVGQELRVPTGRGGLNSGGSTDLNPASRNETVEKGGVYIIQPGDTLSEIAVRAGVSIDSLRQLNNINGDMIRAEAKLLIPKGGKVPTGRSTTTTNTHSDDPVVPNSGGGIVSTGGDDSPVGGNTDFAGYRMEQATVYPTDSLDTLVEYFGAKKADILEANDLTDESQVVEGMNLIIPILD